MNSTQQARDRAFLIKVAIFNLFAVSFIATANFNTDTFAGTNGPDLRPYDIFIIDSTITVNDGHTYTTDSLALISILKANGWGMPVQDSSNSYIMEWTVDSISAKFNGRIVKVDLDGVLLTCHWAAFGVQPDPLIYLPADIGKLTALQFLSIGGNHLDSLAPELGNLFNLTDLRLGSNHLTKLPPEIGRLRKLQWLFLNVNELESLPDEIEDCDSLLYLIVSDNQLVSLPDSIIKLQYCRIWPDSNNLCSLNCNVQAWLDTYGFRGSSWRSTQRCTVVPVPPCSTISITHPRLSQLPDTRLHGLNIIYDLRGRYVGTPENGLLPAKLPAGIYISKTIKATGNILKRWLVR